MTGTIILLHGLGGSARTWSRMKPLLGDSGDLHALDLTGTTTIEDDALEVARRMRTLDVSRATLVGHSRGGLVATSVAEQFPSMVTRLVLVCTPPTTASRLTARSASEKLLRIPLLGPVIWAALPQGALRRGLATAFAPAAGVPDFAVDDLIATGRARLVANGDAIDHYLDDADLSARLDTLQCPIDVVYGLNDRRVAPAAIALSARGRNRRAFELPHDGHGAPWTAPGAVADVVLGHASATSDGGPGSRTRPHPGKQMRPHRWTPPPAPARARERQSEVAMGTIERIELPGRGPEDVRVDVQGRILTGLEDGRILRVTLGDRPIVETVADTGGRPLGIAVVDNSTLLVCDSEQGLLRVNVDTGETSVLISEVDGVRLNFASNVVVGKSGCVYFTASTRRFGFEHYLADLLEHSGTGRLLRLDPDGSVRTLVDGLQFANGLVVSDDETLFTVAETGSFRLARYRDTGSQVVSYTPLNDNLPGFPDNLSSDGDLVWISLANSRSPLFDAAARLPGFVRKLAYSLPESVRSGDPTTWVMAVDSNGTTVCDLQTASADFSTVTSVIRTGRHLVMGSITESAIAVVNLPHTYATLLGTTDEP